jgi:hypothetical protein
MKGYKTIIFNISIMVLAIIGTLEQSSDIIQQLFTEPKNSMLVIFVIGLIGNILRTLTSTPIFNNNNEVQKS